MKSGLSVPSVMEVVCALLAVDCLENCADGTACTLHSWMVWHWMQINEQVYGITYLMLSCMADIIMECQCEVYHLLYAYNAQNMGA